MMLAEIVYCEEKLVLEIKKKHLFSMNKFGSDFM